MQKRSDFCEISHEFPGTILQEVCLSVITVILKPACLKIVDSKKHMKKIPEIAIC